MIEFIDRKIPNAYHGTSRENVEQIFRDNRFVPSGGEDHYLGSGIYFYEGSRELAEKWARKKFRGDEIGIIIAEIQLGRCLDLTIPECRTILKDFKSKLEKKRPGLAITDPFVINLLCQNFPEAIETVRAIYSLKDIHGKFYRIFIGSRLYDDHITICVRKDDNILNFQMA
jgi:hypothetical protein